MGIKKMNIDAVAKAIDREKKREAFRQDTIKACEEYQETGLYATAAEVDTWLAGWGTENELPAPLCHSRSISDKV